jgi:hypothetical protein
MDQDGSPTKGDDHAQDALDQIDSDLIKYCVLISGRTGDRH